MAETCSERREKLQRALALLTQLIEINEQAARLDATLHDQGVVTTDRETAMNALLDSGGPPRDAGAALLELCLETTISGAMINVLNFNDADGIDWSADSEED